jgi:hypothetical protein
MHVMRRILMLLTAAVLTVTTAAAPAAAAAPRPVPERLMLQPADLGGAPTGPVEDTLAFPLLPQPCADSPLPRPNASRSLAADFSPRHRVYENVARFPGARAQAYLDRLKAQLERCRAGGDQNGFRLVAEDHLGPDTVLFELQYDEGSRWAAYVAAAVGRYVVVVLVTDPVVGGGDLTTANSIAAAAVRRVTPPTV